MRKSLYLKVLFAMLICMMSFFAGAKGVYADTKNKAANSDTIDVTFDIDYYKRTLSPKHSVDMYIDGIYHCTFNCGERKFYGTVLSKGSHDVAFCKKSFGYWDDGSNSFNFKADKDCLISTKISGAAGGAKCRGQAKDIVAKDYNNPGAFIDEKITDIEKKNSSTIKYFVQYDQKNKSVFVCINCKKDLTDKVIKQLKPRFLSYYPEKTKIQYIITDPSNKKSCCYDNDIIEASVPLWYSSKSYDYWWK